ncbi:serine/threonine protein kinase [Blastococcus sp. CT_GayMR19]|uniref:serine/threonine-protein kinase n=1 Tax=Blastococcus sp. CT_GayMR19 TaxID=2559608 RepID=UPI00107469FA|nr:serine/threonine-protein kinase [Blastococcus sp. CT_GayMR19]TFV69973.1 serine/threonine protein kinase [Blastococcus sp. CT_GayMR19]
MTRPVTTPGRLVAGRYRLKSQLGGGGMGTVWLARDELLGREVAIKQVLSPQGVAAAEADQQRQRALREGRIAARLSHPHAISVYDVALESGQPWLVMEYLPSRSLATVLTEDGVLRVDQVAQIGAQVADALAATHAAGIVHRDVKPANILIGQGGRIEGLVKITDFGISHAAGDITLTQTGQITGTPAFLAPEVAQGREMTEASDVFSLGATLYTCIEGQPPFGMEDNALGMLHRVAGGQITPPRRAGSLTKPLLRMLAAEPADRPAMPEIRDELAKLAAGRFGDTTTVLLARTDLGSSEQGRNRTTAFPAGGTADDATPPPVEPAAPTPPPPLSRPAPTLTGPAPSSSDGSGPAAVAPVAGAAAPVPDRAPPPPAPRTPGRRRGRALWLLVALVAVVFAGLIAFWVVSLDDPVDSSDAQTSTSAPSTSAEPTAEEPAPSAQPTAQETSAEPTPEAPADPLSAASITTFLGDYHQQVLSDPRAAYARTGPTLRANIGEAAYVDYWSQFSDVRVSDIQAVDGQTTATASLELVFTNGTRESGLHQFTFLVQDGQLLLDSDFPA